MVFQLSGWLVGATRRCSAITLFIVTITFDPRLHVFSFFFLMQGAFHTWQRVKSEELS